MHLHAKIVTFCRICYLIMILNLFIHFLYVYKFKSFSSEILLNIIIIYDHAKFVNLSSYILLKKDSKFCHNERPSKEMKTIDIMIFISVNAT